MTTLLKARVLIVDDDPSVGIYYEKILARSGFQCDVAASLGDLLSRLSGVSYDIILLDLNLGEERGLDGLAMILKEAPFTQVYVLTANGSVPRAVEAMRRGAAGFFEKGGDVTKLVSELVARVAEAEAPHGSLADLGLIGHSPALTDVADKIQRLKDVDSMVLLLGESGTGKEVVARAIHRTSGRGQHRFHAINCGAIPEALLESELFGHKKGAFTDAKTDRKGVFELCSDGTLLLDEIGDMPLPLQMKLLRVLQEREITPVGSSQSIKINTRVIAATHRDILAEARAKRFREDLYYRLSIVVLHIPPLRHRLADIPVLVDHFLATFNRRFGREIRPPGPSVLGAMLAYEWPGNIRELQNAIERSVVLSTNDQLDVKDLFAHLSFGKAWTESPPSSPLPSKAPAAEGQTPAAAAAPEPALPAAAAVDGTSRFYDLPLTEAKQAFERSYLEHQLQRCNGHVLDVAERSGRYRADVYRLLSRYGIDHAEFRS